MSITVEIITVEKCDVQYIEAVVGVRYWEDATVNGVEDTDGILIPGRSDDIWKILIDVDTGIILNWETGKSAKVHYKVCDDGMYHLLDKNMGVIQSVYNCYVPTFLSTRDGYGDYVIMDIDETGKIQNWDISKLHSWVNTYINEGINL